MPLKVPSTTGARSAAVPLSTVFRADDADVVIRAAGTRDFRVHKPILSLVSPIFRDMFTLPQPPTDTPDILPHVDVDESVETWENILRTIYPMPNPVIDNLYNLESLFLTAMKYEMQSVIDIHKKSLENRAFIQQDPLRLYAIACSCGFTDQAKHVARNAELVTVMRRADTGDLRGLTVGSYHNLVSFLTRRDNQWHQVLSRMRVPDGYGCSCYKPYNDTLYNSIKETLKIVRFSTEEVYLKALEDRLRTRQSGCVAANCSIGDSEIKGFIERAIKEREKLCDQFVPGPLVPGHLVPYSTFPDRLDSTSPNQLDPTVHTINDPVAIFFIVVFYSCIIFSLYRLLRWIISFF